MHKTRGHVVLLEPTSTLGRIYAAGENNGIEKESQGPLLFCSEMTMDSPFGIAVVRPLKGGGYAQMLIPYHCVVGIWDVTEKSQMPFGFVAPASVIAS